MKKRILSLLLMVCMLLTMLPMDVFASNENPVNIMGFDGTCDLTVMGGTLNTDYSYEDNTLRVLTGTAITVSGTTTKDRIVVESGVTANITLNGVDISVNGCAFEVLGTANIILANGSTNILKSSGMGVSAAGLQVQTGASIVIDGQGTLEVTGGEGFTYTLGGAGIGGGFNASGGTITINGGNIIANGNSGGAGIGGGYLGNGGIVTINGGNVTANGYNYSAGIGGGWGGAGGTVIINDGNITASSDIGGAGIGGGFNGVGGDVTINGGNITAKGQGGGRGIGRGDSVSISDGNLSIKAGMTVKGGTSSSDAVVVTENYHEYMYLMIEPTVVTKYNVWVGGIQVTSVNKDDVLGDIDTGETVKYDSDTNTLTLNNFNYSGEGYYDSFMKKGAAIYVKNNDISINLLGINSVTRTGVDIHGSSGIYVEGNITIYGTGSLASTGLNATYTYGIECSIYGSKKSITILSGTVTAFGGDDIIKTDASYGIAVGYGDINIFSGEVNAISKSAKIFSYGIILSNGLLKINGGTVTAKSLATSGTYAALNRKPILTNYPNCIAVGSTSNDGTNSEPYVAGNNSLYKYFKVMPQPEAQWGLAGSSNTAPTSWVGSGSLSEAMNYANIIVESGSTAYIQLLANVTTTSAIEFKIDKTTVLDLNGRNIDGGNVTYTGDNQSVLYVVGQLTLCDSSSSNVEAQGKITGGTGTSDGSGGGVYVDSTGVFTMLGGNITGNTAVNGGGIMNEGTFSMVNGSIANNSCINGNTIAVGGGVANNGNFNITGGSITGNIVPSGGTGGGVANIGNMTISGNVNISGNKVDTANNNLVLVGIGGKFPKISLAGALTNTNSIGVSIVEILIDEDDNVRFLSKDGVFTSGTAVTNSDYADKFTSENSEFIVITDANQLKLAKQTSVLPTIDTLTIGETFIAGTNIGINNIENYKPTVTANGRTITAQGWQYAPIASNQSESDLSFVIWNAGIIVPDTMSQHYLRYYVSYTDHLGEQHTVYSNHVKLSVEGHTTALSIIASPETSQKVNTEVTLTATLIGYFTGPGVNGQNITFKNSVTEIGTAKLNASGVATFSWTPNAVGNYAITAEYAATAYNKAASSSSLVYEIIGVPSTYAVTVNGSYLATSGAGNYTENATVTINAGTRSDYSFKGWTSSDGVSFENANSATTSFIMPAKAVTVTANWIYNGSNNDDYDDNTHDNTNDNTNTSPQTSPKFVDVQENDWFAAAVYVLVNKDLFSGTSETTFSPYLSTTRGMIATVLWRMENKPSTSVTSIFEDVASDIYYADGINWAQANRIASGYGNGKFGPDDNITREQMAAILYRYAQFKGYDVSKTASLDSFSDGASTSEYAKIPMAWAVANGLINGKGNRTLDPLGNAIRAEVVTILIRFDEMFIK